MKKTVLFILSFLFLASFLSAQFWTLDFETAKLVHKALLDSIKGGMTMVVTSHWPYVIKELSEKTLWLENGEVMRPTQPGVASLILSNVTAEMDGNVYQVRATSAGVPVTTDIGDAYRHSTIGTLTVT